MIFLITITTITIIIIVIIIVIINMMDDLAGRGNIWVTKSLLWSWNLIINHNGCNNFIADRNQGINSIVLSAPKDPDAEAKIKQHLESAKTAPPSAVTFIDSDNEP